MKGILIVTDINQVWINVLQDIIHVGTVAQPRGESTSELLAYKSIVDMATPYLSIGERGLGNRFRAAEAAWILSGQNKVSSIKKYAKAISDFSDDGYFFRGAYGPQIISQLPYIIDLLNKSKETRQAVITIWNRNPAQSKDIPCTVSIQFLIRQGALNLVVNMRSSDAWLGWPYDVHNFSCLAAYVLLIMSHLHGKEYTLGTLYLIAGSQHIYNYDYEKALRIVDLYVAGQKTIPESDNLKYSHFCDPEDFIRSLWETANGK